jgi:hypothetical protein
MQLGCRLGGRAGWPRPGGADCAGRLLRAAAAAGAVPHPSSACRRTHSCCAADRRLAAARWRRPRSHCPPRGPANDGRAESGMCGCQSGPRTRARQRPSPRCRRSDVQGLMHGSWVMRGALGCGWRGGLRRSSAGCCPGANPAKPRLHEHQHADDDHEAPEDRVVDGLHPERTQLEWPRWANGPGPRSRVHGTRHTYSSSPPSTRFEPHGATHGATAPGSPRPRGGQRADVHAAKRPWRGSQL